MAENCCYGKKAAEDMEIKDITPSSAYHVSYLLKSNGRDPESPKLWFATLLILLGKGW